MHQEFVSVYSEDELKAVNLVHDLSDLEPLYQEFSKVGLQCVCMLELFWVLACA